MRVAPGGHPERRGRLDCPGQRFEGAAKVGLRHGHRLAESGGSPFDFAPQRRQGLLGAPVAVVGQRTGLDVVGQREEVQERLGLGVQLELLSLEGRDVLMPVAARHAGTLSIIRAAWRWASQRGQPCISVSVSA